jgi:pilus assembly protein CpaC
VASSRSVRQRRLTNDISIVFKEFGVRLKFKPTIAGDLIRLHVRPEVSSLDFNNGILLEGFRIPPSRAPRRDRGGAARRQSFAIAGLINNESQNDTAALPILSQIPIVGALFKSNADRKERTELLVIVTPRLVRPLNPDEVPPLPTLRSVSCRPATTSASSSRAAAAWPTLPRPLVHETTEAQP